MGLNRRPEGERVADRGVCKLDVRVHAQIMTVDLARGLIGTTDFASIARANGCATNRSLNPRTAAGAHLSLPRST